MNCRHCRKKLSNKFVDLGFAPHSNAYLNAKDINTLEKYFPLTVYVCNKCWLVQTIDYSKSDDLFKNDYAYFSSTSKSFLDHAKKYSLKIIKKLNLNDNNFVVELASNDGYLLKNFVSSKIPCLGIEPTKSTADAARDIGIPVEKSFFSSEVAKKIVKKRGKADLIIGNNVYAHVPNINDFTLGLKKLLDKEGSITLEFPHLLELIRNNQFDTIYHEHFSYLSLIFVNKIFKKYDLRIYDVDKIKIHGGSIRIYACHKKSNIKTVSKVKSLLIEEKSFGLDSLNAYQNFQEKAEHIKNDMLDFLIRQKRKGKKIIAYGAAAKGNTLLNYAGIKTDLISSVLDAAPSKQGKFLPGSHIPILSPTKINYKKPDYIVIFPWNLKKEIKKDILDKTKNKNIKFVTFIPHLKIYA